MVQPQSRSFTWTESYKSSGTQRKPPTFSHRIPTAFSASPSPCSSTRTPLKSLKMKSSSWVKSTSSCQFLSQKHHSLSETCALSPSRPVQHLRTVRTYRQGGRRFLTEMGYLGVEHSWGVVRFQLGLTWWE